MPVSSRRSFVPWLLNLPQLPLEVKPKMHNENQTHSEAEHLGPDLSVSTPCIEVFMIHNRLYGSDRYAPPRPNRSQVLPDYKRKRYRTHLAWAY